MSDKHRTSNLKKLTIAGTVIILGVLVLAGIATLTNIYEPNATTPSPTLTPSLAAATIIEMPVGQVVTQPVVLTYTEPVTTIITSNATYIQPFFGSIDIAPDDLITVSAADGSQLSVYNAEDANQWAFPIDGDTAIVSLIAANALATGYTGVEITQYGRGNTPREIAQSVCGSNDMSDAICSAGAYPAEYALRQPVARMIYTSGSTQYVCTTWRVSPGNFMVTNEHCIKSQAILNTAVIRFNYQRTACGGGGNEPYTEVRGGTLLMVNATYDIALFSLRPEDFARVGQYGFLELDPGAPAANETIFIPQHPAGMPKQFGINSTQDGGRCRINAASLAGYAQNSDFGYTCDTQGGSSGSPVIALDSMRVIGLHHLGSGRTDGSVCGPSPHYNQAVKIEHIAPLLVPYIGTPAVALVPPTPTATFTPPATNTPMPTFTPTQTPTPTATPPRTSRELLQDGGFEERSSAWVLINAGTGDKFKPRKTRTGLVAYQLRGGEPEKTTLTQEIPLDGVQFAAGDQVEFIAHIDQKGTLTGFMRLVVIYADGRKVKSKTPLRDAGRYEPRAAYIILDSPDVARIAVAFRHRSLDANAFAYIDDASVIHSGKLP